MVSSTPATPFSGHAPAATDGTPPVQPPIARANPWRSVAVDRSGRTALVLD